MTATPTSDQTLQQRLDNAVKTYKEQQTIIKDLATEVEDLRKQVADLEEDNDDLRSEINVLEDQISDVDVAAAVHETLRELRVDLAKTCRTTRQLPRTACALPRLYAEPDKNKGAPLNGPNRITHRSSARRPRR